MRQQLASAGRLIGPAGRFAFIPALLLFAFFNTLAVAQADALSQQAARGKQIYSSGSLDDGAVITAEVGKEATRLPASAVPCASCHGPDGRGRPEGGVLPTDITWGYLTKNYGHQHAYGRSHGPFTEASVATAITRGLDPDGNRLDPSMPRYRMDPADLDALISYLKRLQTDRDPGLGPRTVRLATLLPTSGDLAPLGKAMAAVMTAGVEKINARGGVHGRRLELQLVPFGGSAEEALGNLQGVLDEQGVFALVGGFGVGLEVPLASLAEQQQVPLVGPYTLTPASGHRLDRYTFYLFSGVEQQVRVLVDYAATGLQGQGGGIALVGPDTPSVRESGAAAQRQARTHGWATLEQFLYPPGKFDAVRLGAELHAAGSDSLLFLGTSDELLALLAVLEPHGRLPRVFLPSIVATPALFEAPRGFDGRLFVAYPTLPSDVTPYGRQAYAALKQNHPLPAGHISAQLAAYAALRTLVEGLKRSGRDLSRERLVEALQGLSRFQTGLTPPITYTLNRRIGALGAHILQLNLTSRRYNPARDWMPLK